MDGLPMVNSKGKLREDTPPNWVWIVWTTGWVEPCDKSMMFTILGWWPCSRITIIHLSGAPNHTVGNSPLFHQSYRSHQKTSYWMTVQKLQEWCSFWIQEMQQYCGFLIQKSLKWTKIFLDQEIVEMVQFLDPEIVKMVNKSLMSHLP